MEAVVCGLLLFLAPHVSEAAVRKVLVICSVFPLADIVQQVGGERLQALTLIPPGASAHTYEPTPEQVRRLAEARVFFQIGLGLEFWLDKLVRAAKNPALRRVDLSQSIVPLPTPHVELAPASGPGKQHAHEHRRARVPTGRRLQETAAQEGLDPHYWLDPVRMQEVLATIEQVLRDLDPEDAAGYTQRAARVRGDLTDLHQEILQQTHGLHNRRFIAMHSAWTYFAPRYNLEQVAVIEPFPGREPSPRYLADLARLMQRDGVRVIFMEPQLSRSAAEALAREVGAKVGVLDPTGGPGIPGRDSYQALMRYNTAQLVQLLQ